MSSVDLNGGERTILRRALIVYVRGWMDAKLQHKKAGDSYNAGYDQDRIEACNRLYDKLRLSDPSASKVEGPDPYEAIQALLGALRTAQGHQRELAARMPIGVDAPVGSSRDDVIASMKANEAMLLELGGNKP